ncbi:MAG: class I SAM-dependent methyltransferase [Anaerolineae bacterium]|nr:class I SAM-dependent methyltransferase [Anaerolineae bacterium]
MQSHNTVNGYAVEPHVAEIYDQVETYTDDVELIREHIRGRRPWRILEPFCGTGRILIPLALDGHELVGFEGAQGMLARARAKVAQLPEEVQRRVNLFEADVTAAEWPRGFDLVIIGGNCFYELATPQEQEGCITSAAASLKPGGYVYVDNNHMEGSLDASWREPGVSRRGLSGTCADGARVESASETVWYDAPRRLVKFHCCTRVALPDGRVVEREYVQQKYPPATSEAQEWLWAHGFEIEHMYGDRMGNPYTDGSKRAIFWARKL